MKTLADYERERQSALELIAAENKRHEQELLRLTQQRDTAAQGAGVIIAGIDDSLVTLAESVIYVRGQYINGGAEKASQVNAAIKDLLAGAPKLRGEYFGTKDYDRWHGQASNHGYGYGPKHGSIIFAIGLKEDVRRRQGETLLTEEEISAAVYYLRCLPKIQEARATATA